MHAGRGDLERLRYDLASGILTDGVPVDYVLLLQEDLESLSALTNVGADLALKNVGADLQVGPGGAQHSARAVAETNGLSFFFSPVRRDDRRMSGNAILSTRPLLEPRSVSLARQRQPRSAVAATIRLDSASLFLVDVHMENRLAWWRLLFSDTARGKQAAALLREIPQQGDGILGGDLNTWLGPREPAWQLMLRRFPDTPRDPLQPTFHDRLVLDHLFFDLPDGWSVTRRVLKDAYGSDHHPVIAVITAGPRRAGVRRSAGPAPRTEAGRREAAESSASRTRQPAD
jgi:endonuclease/exonuclease/phosphatase family metal-dependent hydrolase